MHVIEQIKNKKEVFYSKWAFQCWCSKTPAALGGSVGTLVQRNLMRKCIYRIEIGSSAFIYIWTSLLLDFYNEIRWNATHEAFSLVRAAPQLNSLNSGVFGLADSLGNYYATNWRCFKILIILWACIDLWWSAAVWTLKLVVLWVLASASWEPSRAQIRSTNISITAHRVRERDSPKTNPEFVWLCSSIGWLTKVIFMCYCCSSSPVPC